MDVNFIEITTFAKMTYNENSINLSRSRLLGSSDHVSLLRESILSPLPSYQQSSQKSKQLSNFFSNNIFLDDEWHCEDYLNLAFEEFQTGDDSWRLKGRMKTAGVALVVCLNIGVDPPDVIKPSPCARKECWFDPTLQKAKGMEYIGNALQAQYEKWQAKAKFKQCLDPSSEELRKVCLNLRKTCRSDRLLLHYNGHGVPKPTKNGELWVFGKHHTHYTPVAVREMRTWLADPTIYVLDCSGAGVLIPHLVDSMAKEGDLMGFEPETPTPNNKGADSAMSFNSASGLDGGSVVLAACKANEQLPFHPNYPADIFTSCLTTPTTIAIRWFIIQNPESMRDVNPDIAENIPGKDNDRKSPRGELNWILTAITDTIAWNTLPAKMFKRMFRHDLLVASLFRNFLMAKRVMKSFSCTPQSYPVLPDSTTHSLWQAWDTALGSFLTQHVSLQKGASMVQPCNNMSFSMPNNLSFFNDQLTAFEMWLDFGTANSAPPLQLPVVLQVLLSQSHRLRALQLLKRYLSLGLEAVKIALILGIYPYIVKLLQNPAEETKQILISIWAAIIGFDATCRQELIREKSQVYFIQCMTSSSIPTGQRCLAAFVLSEICNGSKEGQQSCIQLGLHRACTNSFVQDEVMKSSTLKLWITLCLYKLCQDFLWAKYLCITEVGHTEIYPLLIDPDPTVRTAAVLALGELFGASSLTNGQPSTPNFRQMQNSLSSSDGEAQPFEEKDLIEAELQLALQILECCTDGSVMVRLEAVYALSKFFMQPAHIDCVKIVAKAIYERYNEKTKATNKAERRSASPVSEPYGKAVYPWFLTPAESRAIADQVEAFIEIRNEEWTTDLQHVRKSLLKGQYAGEPLDGQTVDGDAEPSLPTLMASAYVRLWLALTEVEGKDPHALISQAVATIRFRVHALVAIDERDRLYPRTNNSAPSPTHSTPITRSLPRAGSGSSVLDTPQASSFGNSSFGNFIDGTPSQAFANWANVNATPSPRPLNMMEQKMKKQFSNGEFEISSFQEPSTPGAGSGPGSYFGSPGGEFTLRPMSPYGSPGRPKTKLTRAIGSPLPGPLEINMEARNAITQSVLATPTNPTRSPTPVKNLFLEVFKDYINYSEEDLMVCFGSNHYEMAKKKFLSPAYPPTYDPFYDPLSQEAKTNSYRISKLKEMLHSERHLQDLFRDVEDRNCKVDYGSVGKSPAPSIVPVSNICKFEQKGNTLTMDSPMTPSMVMFHAFQDVLVVAHGNVAEIWSTNSHTRIMEVRNKHTVRQPPASTPQAQDTTRETNRGTLYHRGAANPYTAGNLNVHGLAAQNDSNARITAMAWVNESYDALLLLGSDDGVVRVWRDTSHSDFTQAAPAASTTISPSTPPAASASSCELVTAFCSLPDIDLASRGSGTVLSWQQTAGTLVVGGNSSTIRVWDLGREQNVRTFHTGHETCLTALATTTVSNSTLLPPAQHMLQPHIDSTPVTWTFAGFADGTIAVYDERVHTNGGRVHFSHTHSNWVSHAHLRADVPEVVIGSVRGAVKFWDLRTQRTYKTLEVQKSPLTALSVHSCAPIMATGSHAQFIKILTLSGEQIGNIIKYYDGFLGQRIGPVSSLAFHPHKLLLAASSTDGIVSLYQANT